MANTRINESKSLQNRKLEAGNLNDRNCGKLNKFILRSFLIEVNQIRMRCNNIRTMSLYIRSLLGKNSHSITNHSKGKQKGQLMLQSNFPIEVLK